MTSAVSQPRRFGRRSALRGAAVLGVAVPVLLREQSTAFAATPATPAIGPRWIAFGADPTTQMYASWSMGTAGGATQTVLAPAIRWGTTTAYGTTAPADSAATVVLPTPPLSEPLENTVYFHVLLSNLRAATTYHYSVSNDGATWSSDATFTTAPAAPASFRFTAFGDSANSAATAGPMASLVASLQPAFHVQTGDLAYATPQPMQYPNATGFTPASWDSYFALVGPRAAQSTPWMISVGSHEIEPLGNNGYAGFVTRFAQPYDLTSGSPVVHTFTYGNVGVIHLDGNDLSAQIPVNPGYTGGAQTAWLRIQLAAYRKAGSGIDFIVVVLNACAYSSNTNHGSDGGIRDAWGPLFDTYQVDLVLSGHVHAYERTNPMRAAKVVQPVAAGGTIDPTVAGTTYICCGGGGNGLYTSWYGATGSGDAGSATAPKIWRWSGGDTSSGGSGKSTDSTDSVTGFSAVRRGVFHCLVVDVTPPVSAGGSTSMVVRAMMPAQTSSSVTSIASPTVIDSITLTRTSQVVVTSPAVSATPTPIPPSTPTTPPSPPAACP